MESKIIIEMIFMVVGGLGIFLLGMKNMSEGMQAVAGDKLRKLIATVTNNRLIACGVGTTVTCLVQSSSITTVTVVGMVNSGLMNLTQAIGVIFGANIGTTITGWILVIKVGKYGLPLLGVSALIFLFSRNEKLRYTASICMGLGMVFYGLSLMKSGFAPIKSMPEFVEWFSRFSPDSYFGVLKCCLVGALLTAIVQSSSATLGITMGLAFQGVIDYPTAAALVLGENIGTTITAYLASLGASTNAKRASYAHMMFNILGVLWITAVFAGYIRLIEWWIQFNGGAGAGVAEIIDGQTVYPHVMSAIALTHTGFNVVNVLLFLPFVKVMANFLNRIVPDKAVAEEPRLTALNIRMLDAPALGVQQSHREILMMGKTVNEMMQMLKELFSSKEADSKKQEVLFSKEREADVVQKEIMEFLSNIMTGNISHELAEEGRNQLRIADEYESISDYVVTILKLKLKMYDAGQGLSKEGVSAILELHDKVAGYITMINNAVENNDNILAEAEAQGKGITSLMKRCRSEHLERVGSGEVTPLKSLSYTDMLNAYRRIKDHGLNIAEVLAGEK
ncbi:MAG: Na/Pi cotransporter family protein [Anaerohalosphaeraceae bacterium]|nr:Na/Pi cotransporter family protein [Anaerohalosphaeraceae bacterium]